MILRPSLYKRNIYFVILQELSRPSEAAKHEVSRRCKDLANFMEYLMDEVNKSNLQLDLPQDSDPTISVSLRRMVSALLFISFNTLWALVINYFLF
jgi:hypothetical protein